MVAESEIRRTIAEYCQTCDDGRFDAYAACFTEDAEVVLAGTVVATGRDGIEAWITPAMPAEKRGKHVTVNPLITVSDDLATAQASTDYLFVARSSSGPRVTVAGRYSDVLRPVGERWLIARREITFL
jgi:uncharacterized protein (TIGR02246 family)